MPMSVPKISRKQRRGSKEAKRGLGEEAEKEGIKQQQQQQQTHEG